MLTRTIPKSGEKLPVIGLGTWQTFDVGPSPAERKDQKEVLKRFLAAGARVIDSSPMYGRAETVVGDLLRELGQERTPFLATKVWTSGREAGLEQMRESMRKMGHGQLDLMQVHNLVDWRTHLPVLREWKTAGRIRYLGITHYQRGAFDELEKLIREESLDFVQLPYSIALRDAEQRLLPAAAEHGTAVLVMRPFESGDLFRRVKGKSLPPWAADFDCTSWAGFFLKYILGHPAVTCPIPATSKPRHLEDNLRAGTGRLPDAKTRARMVEYLGL
ncbi:MAG TPA: aldo/keto reductase [Archangium sp.]|jgi:aryl-alcohol dehydrogenase-like predicted oxidoreductase|uniref:aldo/keto reductase n=1 Tax=Archangium sp. TaxID=1872627 RepID=UPI002ED7CA75